MSDRFKQFMVFARRDCLCSDLTEPAQVFGIFRICNDRGMTCGFVYDIRCRSIGDVFYGSDIGCNDKGVISLKFHKGIWWNKSVNGYRCPSNFCQNLIHVFQPGYFINQNTCFLEALKIGRMCNSLEIYNIFTHHITPDSVILGSIFIIMLLHNKFFQMCRQSG